MDIDIIHTRLNANLTAEIHKCHYDFYGNPALVFRDIISAKPVLSISFDMEKLVFEIHTNENDKLCMYKTDCMRLLPTAIMLYTGLKPSEEILTMFKRFIEVVDTVYPNCLTRLGV